MHNDNYPSLHCDDLGPVIGSFHNEPIRSWDPLDTRATEIRDARRRVRLSTGEGIPVVLLPGEIIHENCIKRTTALPQAQVSIEKQMTAEGYITRRSAIEEARTLAAEGFAIVWRPDGSAPDAEQYALVIQ